MTTKDSTTTKKKINHFVHNKKKVVGETFNRGSGLAASRGIKLFTSGLKKKKKKGKVK